MIALVISACLMGDLQSCHAYRVPLPEQTNPLTCTLFAQPYLAQWVGEHPGLQITKWTCESATVANI